MLVAAGGAEICGIVLVASPELEGPAARLWTRVVAGWRGGWARVRSGWRKLTSRVARLVGKQRTPTPQYVQLHPADSVEAAGSLSLRTALNAGATVDERIAFLLRRDQAVQAELERLDQTLAELPKRWTRDIENASGLLRTEYAESLRRLRDAHLRARLAGVGLLVFGIVLATWGNLA